MTAAEKGKSLIAEWAERLGCAAKEEAVSKALAEKYEGEVLDCSDCGFPCPDHDDIGRCPKCGVIFIEEVGGTVLDEVGGNDKSPLEAAHERREEPKPKSKAKSKSKPKSKAKPKSKSKAEAPEVEEDVGGKVVDITRHTKDSAVAKKADVEVKKALKELKQREARIDKHRKASNENRWDLGKELSEIYRRNLWQAMSEEYTSFKDYCRKRFDFTPQSAMSFLLVAENFTREEVGSLTITSLQLLSKVPDDEVRRQLAEEAKGLTTRELSEKVREVRADSGKKTARAGYENKVKVAGGHFDPGVMAEGKWTESRGKVFCEFEIGGAKFRLDDHEGEGWTLSLKKPKK